MPGLKLTFTLAGGAYASGKYNSSGEDDLEDDDFPPLSPSHNSYYPSSSYNGGTTWTQTWQSYRPPLPSLSYTHQPPATNAYSQTTARTPVLSDHSRGVRHPSVPYTGMLSQSQPSSTCTQASRLYSSFFHTDHVHESPECEGEDGYEDKDDYEYPDEDEYDYGYKGDYGYGYQNEDDYGYQDEDEDEYRYEDGYGYEEDEDQTGDEYEYFQSTFHVPPRVHTGGKPYLLIAPVGGVSSHPRSDEPAGIENLAFAKKLRKQARRKGREMSEAYRRAESAKKKGRFGVAHAHTQDAIAHESEMKELDERAAKIFFRENNKNRREDGEIDLHGLYVAEAIQVAEDQVEIARWRGDEVVHFIVGKGLHSGTGEAKIRPALEDLFTELNRAGPIDSDWIIHWIRIILGCSSFYWIDNEGL
ncbi:hypothetical protein EDB85DRAFT_1886864 [Lactarius pseudohatsudake]|nr:hypothetical protein EDB85DRAFT_1886864 [Lactarius pseudohatsudake]